MSVCSVAVFLAVVLAVSVAVPATSSPVSSSSENCQGVAAKLAQLAGVAAQSLPLHSSRGAAGEVCGSSCCGPGWDEQLLTISRNSFSRQLSEQLRQLSDQLHSHALWVQDILIATVRQGETGTLDTFERAYPGSRQLAATTTHRLFDRFVGFFQSQLSEAQLETALDDFFDNLLPVLYRSSRPESSVHADESFLDCLRRHRRNLRPFGSAPRLITDRVLRMFTTARLYLQLLHAGRQVLSDAASARLSVSSSCSLALARSRVCQTCAGRGSDVLWAPSCASVCRHVVRACSGQLARVMGTAWSNYARQLQQLTAVLQGAYNISEYLTTMHRHLADTAASSTWDNSGPFIPMLEAMCGSSTSSDGVSVSAVASASVRARSDRRERRRRSQPETIASYGDFLQRLPLRDSSANLTYSRPSNMKTALQSFSGEIQRQMNLFHKLDNWMCVWDRRSHQQHSSSLCWDGQELVSSLNATSDDSASRGFITEEPATMVHVGSAQSQVPASVHALAQRLQLISQMSRAELERVPTARSLSDTSHVLPSAQLNSQQNSDEESSVGGSGSWSGHERTDEHDYDYNYEDEYDDDDDPWYSDKSYGAYDDEEYGDGISGSGVSSGSGDSDDGPRYGEDFVPSAETTEDSTSDLDDFDLTTPISEVSSTPAAAASRVLHASWSTLCLCSITCWLLMVVEIGAW